MRIERRKTRVAEVYTASLNDIMFFLLLFFLIISTMITPAAIKVLLPNSASAQNVATKKNINLAITADLRYFVEDKQVTFDQLEPELQSLVTASGKKSEDVNILLQADKSLNLQEVIKVIDIGNKLHVKMILFTKKEK